MTMLSMMLSSVSRGGRASNVGRQDEHAVMSSPLAPPWQSLARANLSLHGNDDRNSRAFASADHHPQFSIRLPGTCTEPPSVPLLLLIGLFSACALARTA